MSIFEIASRQKFRFPFKGMVQVEDLWDLNVKQLDQVFKTLNMQVKQSSEESLLDIKSAADEELLTKIAIVKHIVNIKVAESNAAKLAVAKRQQKQQLLEILESKKTEDLRGKSVEELQKLIDELED
jgi:adenosine/AMP kinase